MATDEKLAARVATRPMEPEDAERLFEAFRGTPWERRGVEHFEGLLRQQESGARLAVVGLLGDEPVGHASVLWEAEHGPFREAAIPEIQDLTVTPAARERGVGSALLDHAEARIAERAPRSGLGVGLHGGYGAAQRLYVRRGYLPDGHGVWRGARRVDEGARVPLDDDSVLYLTKELTKAR